MNYIPLYRKWRSQSFDEIVGQKSIVTTLKNAITAGRVAHAYLFSGPRGTGKTSTARIFAKALNCKNGPTANPCNTCDTCNKIKNGHAVDVIEIDAASNRGIDEIRDLREKVRYAPVEGKFKVYIIDEVHMLTTEAFNALLKTLEEPPSHVIFVLATTEAQKVPVTIASRCQRLDFRRLSNDEISSQLRKISEVEKITIDKDAVNLIARNSEGSLRDAISLLDQMISLSGTSIKHDDVISVLGTASADVVFEFGSALAKKDTSKLFTFINQMVEEGRSIPQVTRDILNHLRNLMLVAMGVDDTIEESTEHIAKLKEQTAMFDLENIKNMIRTFSRAEIDMKWHPQSRILLEVAVLESIGEAPKNKAAAPQPVEKLNNTKITAVASKSFGVSLSDIRQKWNDALSEVKKKNAFAYISLHEGVPSEISENNITLQFKKGFAFHKARLEEEPIRQLVEQVLSSVYGQNIRISCTIETEQPKNEATKAAEIFNGTFIS